MSFKRILSTAFATLIIFVASAQTKPFNYEAAWKRIDSVYIEKGLTASAMAEINKLYQRAKNEKNNVQLIKALIYNVQTNRQKEEQPELYNIRLFEKEIATAAEPAKSLLQNITASGYWDYFRMNRWRFYNRTETVNFKKDDIATWGAADFHKKITELFLASIANEKLLQQTKLTAYDPILIKGNARFLRPTLYDLLAQSALAYFYNDENSITKPAYVFEIDNPAALDEAGKFAVFNFTRRDTTASHFHALKLFQRLIRFHLNDEKPDALVNVDIQRIQFAYENGIMENKDELYKNVLNRVGSQYPNLPVADEAWYLLARWYATKAAGYDALRDTSYRYAYLKAKEICERVAAKKDTSEGWAQCKNLLSEITRPHLQLQTEKVNVPGQPFRTLVSWKNFAQLHFRLIKIDNSILERINENNDHEDYWQKLLEFPVVKTFSRSLPDTRDHQQHHTEISIDSLSVGQYALVGSVNNDFGLKNNPLAVQFFYVSNIAWIQKGQDYYVLHRETGQPLVRADVQVWYRFYNASTRKYARRKGENIFTDKDGHFMVTRSKVTEENNNFQLEIRTNNDYLYLADYLYNYPKPVNIPAPETKITSLFTDRAIYRPGQIVYVKGIVMAVPSDRNKSAVAPDFSTKLILYDVNGQKLDSLKVTTNEFGSYSGKFTLPSNILNGRFHISDFNGNGTVQFSVEEYKRPRFLTEIKQPTGTYRLNDSIKVVGNAKAYAGNSIDGAVVKYRVTRRAIVPMWRYGYGRMIWPPYPREQMEIAHGETTTDANGNYTIAFKAIPDNKVPKKDQPVFYYTVSADVTDIAGETRSASTSVSVAYQALQLNMQIPGRLHIDSLRTITVSSTNMAGTYEKATLNLAIYKLQPPNRMFRDRYWQQPDTFTMSKEAYYQLFPYDVYYDENDPSKWQRGEKVFDITDTTSPNSKLQTRNAKLSPAWYVVEAITKDKYGEDVKAIQYVQLYDQHITGPIVAANIESNKTTLEPGEKAVYSIGVNVDSAFVIHEIAKKNFEESTTILKLHKNSQSFEIPIAEADRGGLGVSIAFVKNNRIYTQAQTFDVPYTNKELTVTYATYRDKTLPGSQEKWTVTVGGHKGAKAAAEMLTAMYDASLDQFLPHSWTPPRLWNYFYGRNNWGGGQNFAAVSSREKYVEYSNIYYEYIFDELLQSEFYNRPRHMKLPNLEVYTNGAIRQKEGAVSIRIRGAPSVSDDEAAPYRGNAFYATEANQAADSAAPPPAPAGGEAQAQPQVRKNFNETAFFFPDLKTDSAGNITFSFTMPEAVTQWKWMSLAHSKDLSVGYSEKTIVTQKDLMVQPNAPRFLREGDRMDFSTKVANITDKEMTGQVELQLIDPATGTSVDGWFQNMFPNQYFTVGAGQSVAVNFTIEIPFKYNHPVTYKVVARSGTISDGEEATLPVVSNRLLVTETMPLPLRNTASKTFKFEKLLQSGNSETLNHQSLTVEFTSNPAWYAVQSLPYLMEYPYECSEQVFNRYYANALASMIANASPRLKEMFERWKTLDTAALLSNLQKNEELKSVLLQETPWVLQAKSESEQKKNIALLFDMVRMNKELQSSLGKLKDLQLSNGGFAWFKGGRDDQFITQYILTGIGHLKKLNALPKGDDRSANIIRTALPYLDARIKEAYDQMLKANKGVEPTKGGIGYYEIQYLYMRSFYPEINIPAATQKAYTWYRKQAQLNWLSQSRYMQGMIALAMYRTGNITLAKSITASLKQNALVNEEMGMYWAQNAGYFWYQAPIETQSLLIETFSEVTADTKAVNDMKTWLLKQKQTQHWRTTKATADACYALLLQGSDWLTNTPEVTIQLGGFTIRSTEQQQEAGTGYFKKVIEGKSVQPQMGNVEVFIKSQTEQTKARPAWGAVYWQYFEELDKITPASTPLKLTKKLFVERNTDRGPVLEPLNEGAALKVGDKVKVRIELRSDRAMEYVHMKDMRAACLEPVNVLSAYKWQGGLGYYESTKDASTNFFFGYLPKGTFVFEYALFVTHTGTFSNGITSIQCMYAPEFSSHSEGVKIRVE